MCTRAAAGYCEKTHVLNVVTCSFIKMNKNVYDRKSSTKSVKISDKTRIFFSGGEREDMMYSQLFVRGSINNRIKKIYRRAEKCNEISRWVSIIIRAYTSSGAFVQCVSSVHTKSRLRSRTHPRVSYL